MQNLSLIGFYEGTATDSGGRWLTDVQSWDFGQLEAVHDYIQWLFPLRRRSPVNPEAPVIDREVSDAFRSRPELRTALIRSLETMLRFYGYELEGTYEQPNVIQSDQFRSRAPNWMTPGNHNHLRITRILGCLRALGLDRHAASFFRALQEVYWSDLQEKTHAISEESFSFWRSASGLATWDRGSA